MRRDLDILLDECIDRINDGESLDECLASYSEQAEELEPPLRAMFDIRNTLSNMPDATAKAAMRQRLDAAQVSLEKRHRKALWSPLSLFGRPRVFAPVAIALVLALIGFGLYGTFIPGPATPVVAQDNFRLLLSDDNSDITAIGDFESVMVTVLGIGLQKSGGPEVLINATNTEDFNSSSHDLKDYLGPDAVEIWEGHLEPGDYKGAVLYLADDVSGTLNAEAGGGEVTIQVPGNKLHLNIPFTVGEDTESDTLVDYVFDITVFKAGNSGKYIVKPVIKESGPDQKFTLHGAQKDEGEIEFEGTISSIDPLVIDVGDTVSYEVIVDENTKVIGVKDEFTGEHEGLTIRVEGILHEGNVVLASKIKVSNKEEDEA